MAMKKDIQLKNKIAQKNSSTKDKSSKSRDMTPRAKSSTVKPLMTTLNSRNEVNGKKKQSIKLKEIQEGPRTSFLVEKRAFSKDVERSQALTLNQKNDSVDRQ